MELLFEVEDDTLKESGMVGPANLIQSADRNHPFFRQHGHPVAGRVQRIEIMGHHKHC